MASALPMKQEIADRIVVIWLVGPASLPACVPRHRDNLFTTLFTLLAKN